MRLRRCSNSWSKNIRRRKENLLSKVPSSRGIIKEKRKENESHTPPKSTNSEEHEERDNHSEFFHHQSENLEQEENPNVALIKNFQNQLNALVHKNNL